MKKRPLWFAPLLVSDIVCIPVLCSFPGSAWERVLGGSAALSVRRWQSHLGKRSQAEPGNEHWSEFALSLTAMWFAPSLVSDIVCIPVLANKIDEIELFLLYTPDKHIFAHIITELTQIHLNHSFMVKKRHQIQ
jgi:hypothetical protein